MHCAFLTPAPNPAGGGTSFNAGLIPALEAAGHTVTRAHDALSVPPGARPVIDGWLLPELEPHADALIAAGAVAIIHHVSARAGQDKAAKEAVRAIEARLLPRIPLVIATSDPVAERLQSAYGLASVPVLRPGHPDHPRSPPAATAPVHILSAGVLTPRKGHDRLLHALARLTDLDWTLTIAGDAQRDPVHAAAVAALIDSLALQARVTLLPDPSDAALAAEWQRAHLFALASAWEGYPAGAAEALRRGIPVIATTVGELPTVVSRNAGLLTPADDMVTFSKTLRRAIFDHALRTALADGAWQAGLAMPGWPQQALAFLSLLSAQDA